MKFLNHTYTGNQSEATQGFKKTGLDDTHFLLAGGGSTPTNLWATNAQLGNYLPTSGGNITGGLTIQGNTVATQSWVTSQGYLTSASLSGYATQSWANSKFLPLIGGTLTGQTVFNAASNVAVFQAQSIGGNYTTYRMPNHTPYGYIGSDGGALITGGTGNKFVIRGESGGLLFFCNGGNIEMLGAAATFTYNSYGVWHSGNDGVGSGLDADLLDGQHGSYYAPSAHNHAGVYEPVFAKNTAFNKNFGTSAGEVAEGNHTHSGYLNQSLNIDVSAESNTLRINPIEIFIDGITYANFDGSRNKHRLVYIILGSGVSSLSLQNLQPKQRIVIFNISGNTININEVGTSSTYSLHHGYKVSAYKIQNSYYSANSAIFYDKTELTIW